MKWGGGILVGAVLLALLLYLLTRPGEGPAPPPPPPPVPAAPAPAPAPAEPVPAAAEPSAPEPPPPPPVPERVLVVRAVGGELPRTITMELGGETRAVPSPPWADPAERRVPLADVAPGTRVEVSAEGFAPAGAEVAAAGPETVVELGALASVVVTAGGVAAAQPLTVVVRREGEEVREVPLAGPGGAEVAGLVAGAWVIEVRGGPRLRLFERQIDLERGERKRIDVLAGDLGVLVTGRTVTESGEPLSGAVVGFRVAGLTEGFVFARTEVESGRDGRFTVLLPPTLEYELSAGKEGYGFEPRTLGLGAEPPEPLEIVLLRGSGVAGVVVDPEGSPIAGAVVTCIQALGPGQSGMSPSARATTAADGRFRFDEFPPGKTVTLQARKDGRAVGSLAPLEVGYATRDVRIGLPPEVVLEVRLVDAETGEPVDSQHLDVFLGREGEDGRPTGVLLPAERIGRGRFRVRGYDGASVLRVSTPGVRDHRQEWHEFRDAGAGPVTIELVPRGGAAITGRVVDARGRPVAGARVEALYRGDEYLRVAREGWSISVARTGADGAFRLPGLEPDGPYLLTAVVERDLSGAVAASGGPVRVTARAGTEVEIAVERTGGVRARVVLEDPGHPPVNLGIAILAMRLDTGETPEPPPGSPSSFGSDVLRLDGLRPGRYDLRVYSSSHLPIEVAGVVVRAGETTDLGELALREGGDVEAVLRRPDGAAVPGCRVRALGADGTYRYSRKTDASGFTVVRCLPPVEVVLVAGGPGVPWQVVGRLTPTPGSIPRIEATIREPGRLAIRATDARGRPLAARPVEVRAAAPAPLDRILVDGFPTKPYVLGRVPDPLWEETERETGPDGALEIGSLAPGRYEVKVGDARKTVTVAAGETTEVDLP